MALLLLAYARPAGRYTRHRTKDAVSTYSAPIDTVVAQLCQPLPQHTELRTLAFRIGFDYLLRLVARQLHELTVAGYVRNLQIESHTTLLRTFQIARSAQLEVGLGYAETIVCLTHDVDALACFGRKFISGDKYAVALIGTTANPSAQLMELGKTETLCVEYDHDRRIGHIDTHLNNGRGHKNLRLTAHKTSHLLVLLGRLHASVNLAESAFGEYLAQSGVSVLEVLEVTLLALAYHGEDKIDLPSGLYLLADAVVKAHGLVVILVYGAHRLASGWQLVDYAHVEIAINGHGKSARNGRGGHHEDVRRIVALAPKACTLGHSEAVLLVDDGKSETREAHGILYHGVSANEDVHLAGNQSFENLAPATPFDSAGEQFHTDVHVAQKLSYGFEMLFGKYLRWCHDAGLETVAHGYEHGHERHERLAGTHIALQQTVHLLAGTHIVVYLMHHTLLRSCERKGQTLMKERVQQVTGALENIAPIVAAAVAHVAHNVELDVEQFLKLEPLARTLHFVHAVRIVYGTHGRVARHKMQRSRDERRKRLPQRLRQTCEQSLDYFLERMGVYAVLLHALGGSIIWLEAHLREVQFRRLIDVGMSKLETSSEDGGTPEDNVFLANLVLLIYILSAAKPHEIHNTRAVAEVGDDAFLPDTGGELLKTEYATLYLHERHVARQLADAVNTAAVDVFVGIIFEQLSPRGDVEILAQDVPPSGADTGQILYVLI